MISSNSNYILRENHSLRLSEKTLCKCEVLRISESKREEVPGRSRKLHKNKVHNLYSSLTITVIKSRTMRWAGYVACIGEATNTYNIWVGKQK
jgi:hypothetical protein